MHAIDRQYTKKIVVGSVTFILCPIPRQSTAVKAVDSEYAQACREVCCVALDALTTWACLGPGSPGCSYNPPPNHNSNSNNSSNCVQKPPASSGNGGFARLHEDDPASLSVFALLADCLLLSPEGLPRPPSSTSPPTTANNMAHSGGVVAEAQPLVVYDLPHAARTAVCQLAWRYGGYPRFNFLASYGSVALMQPGLAITPEQQQEHEQKVQSSPLLTALINASNRAAAEMVVCAGPSETSPCVISASHLPSFSKELLESLTPEQEETSNSGDSNNEGPSTTPSNPVPLSGTTQASALVFRDAFGASAWVVAEHDCALPPAQATNPSGASSSNVDDGRAKDEQQKDEAEEQVEEACPRLYVPPSPPSAQALAHAAEMAAWDCPTPVPPTPQNLVADLMDDFTDEVLEHDDMFYQHFQVFCFMTTQSFICSRCMQFKMLFKYCLFASHSGGHLRRPHLPRECLGSGRVYVGRIQPRAGTRNCAFRGVRARIAGKKSSWHISQRCICSCGDSDSSNCCCCCYRCCCAIHLNPHDQHV